MNEKPRHPMAGARHLALIRQAGRYRARPGSGPEDPHERRQPDPPHGQTTPTKEPTLRSRTTEQTTLLRRIFTTTNDARYTGHARGRADRRGTTTNFVVVLLVFALGTVVAVLLGPSSPAFAQEETTFRESTVPAGAEATAPASGPEQYSSAAQYQYHAPPGGRLMDTGGVGLIALLIGGVAALMAIGVLATGERGDPSGERQGGGNDG